MGFVPTHKSAAKYVTWSCPGLFVLLHLVFGLLTSPLVIRTDADIFHPSLQNLFVLQ